MRVFRDAFTKPGGRFKRQLGCACCGALVFQKTLLTLDRRSLISRSLHEVSYQSLLEPLSQPLGRMGKCNVSFPSGPWPAHGRDQTFSAGATAASCFRNTSLRFGDFMASFSVDFYIHAILCLVASKCALFCPVKNCKMTDVQPRKLVRNSLKILQLFYSIRLHKRSVLIRLEMLSVQKEILLFSTFNIPDNLIPTAPMPAYSYSM
ncbi:hypothetical protein PZA11_000550 [Diplocarpon coronariae]